MTQPWIGLLAGILFAGQASLALAQQDAEAAGDRDGRKIKKTVTVEIDDDGRVLLDGKVVGREDDPVFFRLDPEDGDVTVMHGAPWGVRVRRGAPRMAWHSQSGDDGLFEADELKFHMPNPAGLLEGLDFSGDLRDGVFAFRLQSDDELRAMERESRALARQARDAEGSERQRLEQELQEKLNAIFDRKMMLQEERLTQMEDKLTRDRTSLQERRDARDEIIERRSRELLGEDDWFEW